MEKRLHDLELKVDELSRTVEQLRARLDASPAARAAEVAEVPEVSLAIDSTAARSAVPLIGRSLLVIAGAFVFRLITERELVTRSVGVSLGLGFAALWVWLAWREAGRGQRLSAAFHAGAGSLIGFSLLLETGARGGLLSPWLGALVLGAFTSFLLVTSWRHRLPEVAWLALLGCLAAGGWLLRVADVPLPFFLVLMGLGAATLVFAEWREGPWLRWPVALFLDLAALRLVFSLAARSEAEQAGQLGAIVLVTQAIIGLYVLALFAGTWLRDRPVRAFEVIQTALVLTVGLATITRVHGAAGPWGLLVAAGAYVTAVYLAQLDDRRFDAWFFGVLGLALTFASGALVWEGASLALFWGLVGLALAALGRRRLTYLFWVGAAVLTWAATVPAGTFEVLVSGLAHPPDQAWPALTLASAALVVVALAGWLVMTVGVKDREEPLARLLTLPLLALAVLGGGALISHGARAWLGGLAASASTIILVRTLLLCGAAVGFALARKRGAPLELGWAAWALLGLGGLKVLLQDLPGGHAGALVIAFLALGLAISAVPRLLKPRS